MPPATPAAFDPAPLHAWLVGQGLRSRPVTVIFEGFCERLKQTSLALARGHASIQVLHAALRVYGLTWQGGAQGVDDRRYGRDEAPGEAWLQSPFRFALEQRLPRLRRRLAGPDAERDFPILRELSQQGFTDWISFSHSFNPTGSEAWLEQLGMVTSWATDAPQGFAEADLAALEDVVGTFALAVKAETAAEIARNLLLTYVGTGAADRVLGGAISRGSIEHIAAAILIADLRGFTGFAEAAPVESVVALLNDSFDAIGTPIVAEGGEILKFLGDGVLAIFRVDGDPAAACRRALAAAEAAQRAMVALAERRRAAGQPALALGQALHRGEVLYGNVGTRDRLDFTIVGTAVNEAARIEGLCKQLGRPLLLSSTFAATLAGNEPRLRSLGRHTLAGVAAPAEIWGVD